MFLEFSKYYFIKSTLKKLPAPIVQSFSYTDDLILNLASFNTLPYYYRILNPFIKDRYKLGDKLKDEDSFNKFILECLYIVKREDKLDKLLFFYSMILNHILDKHLLSYLEAIKDSKLSIYQASNMVDFYIASKYDEINLSEINLYKKYPEAFKVHPYIDQVVHEPLIKIYSQFSFNTMLSKCQRRREFIYHYVCKPNWFNKMVLHIHDFIWRFKHEYPLKDIPYLPKIDTRLLNLSHEEYEIDNIKYNKTLEDVIATAKAEALAKLNAINDFIFNKHDKQLSKEFNIPEEANLDD